MRHTSTAFRFLICTVAAAAFSTQFTSVASAAEWRVIGSRQRGMGGAGVATADDTSAIDWNPAAVGFDTSWGVRVDFDAGLEVAPTTWDQMQSMVDQIDDLQTIYDQIENSQTRLNDGTATEQDLVDMLGFTVIEFSSLQRHDLGLLASANVAAKVHIRKLAFSGGVSVYGDGGFVADLQSLALSSYIVGVGNDAENRLNAAFPVGGATYLPDYYDEGTTGDILAEQLEGIMEAAGVRNTVVDPLAEQMSEALVHYTFGGSNEPGIPDAGGDINDQQQVDMLINMVEATVNGDSVVLDNESGFTVFGAIVQEYAFASSIPIIAKKLSIGATAKMMVGTTYEGAASYEPTVDIADFSDAINALVDDIADNGEVTTNQIGIDLGVLWRPNKILSVGLTGKNVNSPAFDLPSCPEPFKLDPQWRLGVAVRPASFVTIAMDMDVTENRSQVADDYATRFFALGAEFTVAKVLQLRAGTYGNLLADSSQPSYTVGVGLKLGRVFSFDISGNMTGDPEASLGAITSLDTANISDLPDAIGIAASLQFNTKF